MRNGDFEAVLGIGRLIRRWGVGIATVLIACLATMAGGASPASPAAEPAKAPAQVDHLTSLEESTRPLEQYFNQTKHQARFLALLSPT